MAAPSSYHEFTGPEPLAYDGPGTDAGNDWKVKKVKTAMPGLYFYMLYRFCGCPELRFERSLN